MVSWVGSYECAFGLAEPVLRTDLMEQVPQIAFLCHDHPDKLGGLVTGHLVPMVVKFLTDANDLVSFAGRSVPASFLPSFLPCNIGVG